jgi:hypothetical protein
MFLLPLQMYSEDMKDFMVKVLTRSGLSQKGAPGNATG